ncbi:hypothetical protein ACFRR7_27375 [Streptomyces sp. NPDC056909]|uniref:hypothetical protein n=1 Tax=Streptomyces sp. NPDC056909 TaxID=3345963 RepID=UPI00368DD53D
MLNDKAKYLFLKRLLLLHRRLSLIAWARTEALLIGGNMHESENEILVDELAAVAAVTGGSGRLAGLMAKVMRNNIHEIDLVVPMPYEGAVERVVEVQERTGRRLEPLTSTTTASRRAIPFPTTVHG